MLVLGLVARDVVVDALPYFDQGYEAPRVREAATALVGEETRRYRPAKNYLGYLPVHNYSAFETDIMQTKISGGPAGPGTTQYEEVQAAHLVLWAEKQHHGMAGVCEQFMAQLAHQAVRIENLELMFQHGCNVWTLCNEHLVHMIEQAQKELQKLRKNIQDLNWQGKNMQVTAGAKLREMESAWVSLVSKNYEIEGIIVQLENEISQIKQ